MFRHGRWSKTLSYDDISEDFEDWKPLLVALMDYRQLKELCEVQQKAIDRLKMEKEGLEFHLKEVKRYLNR